MSGSGNDFVVIDGRAGIPAGCDSPEVIRELCARGTGVGADGVVFLESAAAHQFRIRYFNRDGSPGELCGNASLCVSNLAVRLGVANPEGFAFESDVGPIRARIVRGEPEIDLQPARDLRPDAGIACEPGERRIGHVDTGVPHLVVLVDDADAVDLPRRGPPLRYHPVLPAGANVNFVSEAGDGWRMRTWERGVEGETLACGTGSAASAILLLEWGFAPPPAVQLRTTSGRILTVTVQRPGGVAVPSLRGEGRLVFAGTFQNLQLPLEGEAPGRPTP
jgi:diaminopimelate epimerase